MKIVGGICKLINFFHAHAYVSIHTFNSYILQVSLSDSGLSKDKHEIDLKEPSSIVSSFADAMTADEADNLLSAR